MKSAANQSPRVLDNLAGYGGDARIAHQVLIVMEATLAKSFAAATHFDVSADTAGIVSINGTGGGAVSSGMSRWPSTNWPACEAVRGRRATESGRFDTLISAKAMTR